MNIQDTLEQKESPKTNGRKVRPRNTVLVVEPNPDQQWKVARMLTLNGYRVIGTSSCDGAVALLKEYPVGIALLAEKLPKMSSSQLARKLLKSNPKLRVVVICDESHRKNKKSHDCRDSKVYEFPAKPLRMDTLSEFLADIDRSVA